MNVSCLVKAACSTCTVCTYLFPLSLLICFLFLFFFKNPIKYVFHQCWRTTRLSCCWLSLTVFNHQPTASYVSGRCNKNSKTIIVTLCLSCVVFYDLTCIMLLRRNLRFNRECVILFFTDTHRGYGGSHFHFLPYLEAFFYYFKFIFHFTATVWR